MPAKRVAAKFAAKKRKNVKKSKLSHNQSSRVKTKQLQKIKRVSIILKKKKKKSEIDPVVILEEIDSVNTVAVLNALIAAYVAVGGGGGAVAALAAAVVAAVAAAAPAAVRGRGGGAGRGRGGGRGRGRGRGGGVVGVGLAVPAAGYVGFGGGGGGAAAAVGGVVVPFALLGMRINHTEDLKANLVAHCALTVPECTSIDNHLIGYVHQGAILSLGFVLRDIENDPVWGQLVAANPALIANFPLFRLYDCAGLRVNPPNNNPPPHVFE